MKELLDFSFDDANITDLDMKYEEYEYILKKYVGDLKQLDLANYVACVSEDTYKLGFLRACSLFSDDIRKIIGVE